MPSTKSWPYKDLMVPEDPEFEAQARARVGAPYEDLVDKTKANHLKINPAIEKYTGVTGLNVKGFRAPTDMNPARAEQVAAQYNPYLDKDVAIKAGNVYTIGDGNRKNIWAHEFRHARFGDETYNRLADAFHANSPKAWDEAVQSWAEHLVLEGYQKKVLPWKEAEKDLIKHLTGGMYEKLQEEALSKYPFTDRIRAKYKIGAKGELLQKVAEPWRLWASKDEE